MQMADLPDVASGKTADFYNAPMAFMNANVVKPISGSAKGSTIASTEVVDRLIDEATSKLIKAEIKLQEPGGMSVKYLYMEQNADHVRAQVQERYRKGTIPVCFLPWGANKIVHMTIPAVPDGLNDWHQFDYPLFFFTAALSGCSVFVKGAPKNPTVYHAGVSEVKIQGDSDQFWAEQLSALGTGYDKAQLRARLSKNNYLTATRPAAQQYKRWLESKNPGSTLNLKVLENTACFFGIRDETKEWKFYVQEQFVSQNFTVSNPKNIEKGSFNGKKTYHDTELNRGADVVETVVPRMLGPFQFGTKIKKTYMVAGNIETSPLCVREVYPSRGDAIIPERFVVEASTS